MNARVAAPHHLDDHLPHKGVVVNQVRRYGLGIEEVVHGFSRPAALGRRKGEVDPEPPAALRRKPRRINLPCYLQRSTGLAKFDRDADLLRTPE
jgi:hypothetical protein